MYATRPPDACAAFEWAARANTGRPRRYATSIWDMYLYKLMVYFINFCLCRSLDNPTILPIVCITNYLSTTYFQYCLLINKSHAGAAWCARASRVMSWRPQARLEERDVWAVNIKSTIYEIDCCNTLKKDIRKFLFCQWLLQRKIIK